MLAAIHVNLRGLLILLVPGVITCVMLALTWYSRAKRPRGKSDGKRRRASSKRRPK
jgi:hypothetical protein